MSACLVSTSENSHCLDELLDALTSNLESLFSVLDCSETGSKFIIYCELGRVYRAELHQVSACLYSLSPISASSVFPLPFFGRLGGLRCLDVVPQGFLLVRQQQLLGQALKKRGLVNLLQFSNLNNLRVKQRANNKNKWFYQAVIVQRIRGLGQFRESS